MVRLPKGEEGKEILETYGAAGTAFWLAAAPFLFQTLEWCALLSLLLIAYEKTGHWALLATYYLALLLLWGYYANRLKAGSPAFIRWEQFYTRRYTITFAISISATLGMLAATWWFAAVFSQHAT